MTEQDLSKADVARRYGISVRTLERWARKGIGPKPIRRGPRLIRYDASEVEAWRERKEVSA